MATEKFQSVDNKHFKNKAWQVFRGGDGSDAFDSLSNILANQRARLRGVIGAARHISNAPVNGDTITIGTTVYEFDNATPPVASDPTYIAVYLGLNEAAALANLVKAINGTVDATVWTAGDGTLPEGNAVVADYIGAHVVRIRYADAQGGTPIPGATGSIALATSNVAAKWSLTNLNTAGAKSLLDQDVTIGHVTITAAMIAAGTYNVELPFTPTELQWRPYLGNSPIDTDDTCAISGSSILITMGGGAAPNLQPGDVVKFLAAK